MMEVLFPTLVVSCWDNVRNTSLLQQEMSISLVASYLQSCVSAKDTSRDVREDPRMALRRRLDQSLWTAAHDYYAMHM